MLKIYAGIGLFICFVIAVFSIAIYFKNRRIKNLLKLKCNIHLKKGGREIIFKKITDNSFIRKVKHSEGLKETMHFIVPEAIQEEITRNLLKVNIIKYIDFDEDIAYPFVRSIVDGNVVKTYLGSERAKQMYKQKVWDEIGGIGNEGIGNYKTIIFFVLIIVVAIIIYMGMQK